MTLFIVRLFFDRCCSASSLSSVSKYHQCEKSDRKHPRVWCDTRELLFMSSSLAAAAAVQQVRARSVIKEEELCGLKSIIDAAAANHPHQQHPHPQKMNASSANLIR